MLQNYIERTQNEIEEAIANNALLEWLEDETLEAKKLYNEQGEVEAVKITIALGGPNVYIDTYNAELYGVWGLDRLKIDLDHEIIDKILDCFRF